jgi:hypothetical protein
MLHPAFAAMLPSVSHLEADVVEQVVAVPRCAGSHLARRVQ